MIRIKLFIIVFLLCSCGNEEKNSNKRVRQQNPLWGNNTYPEIQRPYGVHSSCMSWNDGCNDCSIVTDNGQANVGCTRRYCDFPSTPYCHDQASGGQQNTSSTNTYPEIQRPPGVHSSCMSWSDGCNSYSIDSSGTVIGTYVLCPNDLDYYCTD